MFPIVRTSVHFWETDIYVGQPVAFQLAISVPGNISLSPLSFVSVSVYFSDDALTPLVVHHSDNAPDSDKKVRMVVLGDVSRYLSDAPVEEDEERLLAYLRWESGVSVVFTGTLRSKISGILKLTKVILTIKQNAWWIELPIRLNEIQNYGDRTLEAPRWLTSVDPPQHVPVKRGECTTATYVHAGIIRTNLDIMLPTRVRSRPHQLHVLISHSGPAYLDEECPIDIKITNTDEKKLDVTFDVILHPPEDDSSGMGCQFHDISSENLMPVDCA